MFKSVHLNIANHHIIIMNTRVVTIEFNKHPLKLQELEPEELIVVKRSRLDDPLLLQDESYTIVKDAVDTKNMRDKIESLEIKVDGLDNDNGELKERHGQAEAENAALKERIMELEKENEGLKTNVKALDVKNDTFARSMVDAFNSYAQAKQIIKASQY